MNHINRMTPLESFASLALMKETQGILFLYFYKPNRNELCEYSRGCLFLAALLSLRTPPAEESVVHGDSRPPPYENLTSSVSSTTDEPRRISLSPTREIHSPRHFQRRLLEEYASPAQKRRKTIEEQDEKVSRFL